MKRKSFEQIKFETRQDVGGIKLEYDEPIISPDGYENERMIFRWSRHTGFTNWMKKVLKNSAHYRQPTEDEIKTLAEIAYKELYGSFPKDHQEQVSTGEEEKADDCDSFIRSLKISYESDVEIKIQPPKKPPRVYSFKDLGFRNPKNKGWQVIIQSLEIGFFSVGPFVKGANNAEYDRRQKHLDACEQKLKIFFSQEYGLKIPDDFKFYRLSHDEPPGTYKLILYVEKSDLDGFEQICKKSSNERIKTEINSLTQESVKEGISQAKKNEIRMKLNILVVETQRRGIMNFVTGRDDQEKNPDLEIGRDAPEDDSEESLLE